MKKLTSLATIILLSCVNSVAFGQIKSVQVNEQRTLPNTNVEKSSEPVQGYYGQFQIETSIQEEYGITTNFIDFIDTQQDDYELVVIPLSNGDLINIAPKNAILNGKGPYENIFIEKK